MIYEFADLSLDLDRHQLSRGGEPVKLTKLSFKVLQVLVQASPALVTHDELIDQVWGPNRVITPDNLAQRMKTLRQSLGDNPSEPKYVEGVRGEGYRLVPEVRVRAPGGATRRRKSPGPVVLLAITVLALFGWFVTEQLDRGISEPGIPPVDISSEETAATDQVQQAAIAVLPFTNLSADPANQFFADGIHDDLLTRISEIQDIKTISRTSVMRYRNSDKKLGAIARELGVSAILEGGVQRMGDQVRINLQLIDADTDAHLWAQTYTRALTATNVFGVQAEITEAVANALQAILSEEERDRLGQYPTASLQALDAYFQGNQFFNQETSDGMAKAIEAYKSAISLDPGFSLAYSKQALALIDQVWFSGFPREAQLNKSKPLIDRAIALDPKSSEAYTALGRWHEGMGDIDQAESAYRRAVELQPNNVLALASYGNLMQWDKADPASGIELFRRAAELDPQNVGLKIELAEIMNMLGMAREAIPLMNAVLAIDPESSGAYRVIAGLYSTGLSRHDLAIKAMRKAYSLDPAHVANSVFNAVMHWRLGDRENTSLWMEHAARLAPESELAPHYRGWAAIARGDLEQARREFESSEPKGNLYWIGIFTLARIDQAAGRVESARSAYMKYAPEFDGRKSIENLNFGAGAASAHLALGDLEKAGVFLDELKAGIEAEPSVTFHGSNILGASIYLQSGQKDVALAMLERWIEEGGTSAFLVTLADYELSSLADEPRFVELLETARRRLAEQMANIARWEASGELLPIPKEVSRGD